MEYITGNKIFLRRIVASVFDANGQGRSYDSLRMSFSCKKTERKKLNEIKFQIYNASSESWGLFSKKGNKLQVEAGYSTEEISLIFIGDIDKSTRKYDANNVVFEVECRDGRNNIQRIESKQINTEISSNEAIGEISKMMGFAGVYIDPELPEIRLPYGFTVFGQIKNVLDEITDSVNAVWTIQNERLIVTKKTNGVTNFAFVLSSDSGLINRPEIDEKGIITCTSLLLGRTNPKDIIKLESKEFDGFYIVTEIEHSGDNWDGEFVSKLKLRPRK